MLKEIAIKNFTSFKEEALFSMEADYERVSEHENHIVSINNNKILKVASFYGPNGGGKTNFLYSLILLKLVHEYSSFYNDEIDFSCIFCKSNIIEETVFFIDDEYEIGYKMYVSTLFENVDEIDNSLKINKKVKQLKFTIEREELIYRSKNSNEFNDLLIREKDGTIRFYVDFSNISGELKLSKTKSAIRFIYDTFANNENNSNVLFEVIRHLSEQIKSIYFLNEENMHLFPNLDIIEKYESQLISLLKSVDIKIDSILIKRRARNPISFVRSVIIDGVEKKKIFPLSVESTGTIKIFEIFVSILKNVSAGRIYICDDMNAYLHPKLYRKVVEIFQSNEDYSQLIFNSHDIINMDNELFRRDEIWFAYRDENYNSTIIPLSNIVNYKGEQIRKDAKYYKQYLEGKYGADPYIKKGLSWNEQFYTER